MKTVHSKAFIIFLVILTSTIMLSGIVLASGLNLPLLDYTGTFNYNDGSGGKASNKYLLTFGNLNITNGQYADGTSFGEGDDAVTDAWFEIGNLYNDDFPDNLIFGNTNNGGTGSSGTTGPVSFTLTNGTVDFFTGEIDNFVVTRDSFGTRLNPLFDQENIINLTFDPTAPSSRYIDEFELAYDTAIASGSTYRPNFFGSFSFTAGSSDFTTDASGTISGKLAAAPEPVSSILFLSGAATLGVRRFWKKKKIATS